MRCQCCNRNLSDYESVLRHPETNDFLDICVKCLQDIPIEPVEPAGMVDDTGYDSSESDLEFEFFDDEEQDE